MYQTGWLYIMEVIENYFKMFPHKLAYIKCSLWFPICYRKTQLLLPKGAWVQSKADEIEPEWQCLTDTDKKDQRHSTHLQYSILLEAAEQRG